MEWINFVFIINLALLAIDHIVTGVLALFFPKQALSLYKIIFGAHLPQTQEYFVILKPWGALGIFAGIIGVLPIMNPEKYKMILWALLALLGCRVYTRLANSKYTQIYLGLTKCRNLFHVLLIATCAGIICSQLIYLS